MTTLATLRTTVRNHLDEIIPRFWGDPEVTARINDALVEIARRTMSLRKERLYTVRADQQSYIAPEDMLRIYRVEYRQTPGSISYALEYQSFLSMDDLWYSSRETSGGEPNHWTFWGFPGGQDAQIYLYPIPSTTIRDGLRVMYYGLPRTLIDEEDEAELPAGWENLVVYHVECNARRKEAKDTRWRDAQALFEQGLQDMVTALQMPTDQMQYFGGEGLFTERYGTWGGEW